MLNPPEVWLKIKASKILDEDDTSIIFYGLDYLKQQLDVLTACFSDANALHTVAIKTNPHPEILKFIVNYGFGLEAASFDEVLLAKKIGCSNHKIVFNSPVKTQKEINYAIENLSGIQINANTLEELNRYNKPHDLKLGLRINTLVNTKTSSIYNVSTRDSKFGVPINQRDKIIKAVIRYNIKTLHVHVGSQVEDFTDILNGIHQTYTLAEEINSIKTNQITTINIGGGLFSGNNEIENKDLMVRFTNRLREKCLKLFENYKIITEYGQWTHRFNGCAFSKIEYITNLDDKKIAFIHLGADFFLREIYTSNNKIDIGVVNSKTDQTEVYDLAGPLCYNGDFIAKHIILPSLSTESIIYLNKTGSNSYGLWSRHCSRTIPKFITLDNSRVKVLSNRWNPFTDIINSDDKKLDN